MTETSTGKNETKYSIDTELSSGNVKFFPEFLERNYLLQKEKYREIRNIEVNIEKGKHLLSYRVLAPKTSQYVDVLVSNFQKNFNTKSLVLMLFENKLISV